MLQVSVVSKRGGGSWCCSVQEGWKLVLWCPRWVEAGAVVPKMGGSWCCTRNLLVLFCCCPLVHHLQCIFTQTVLFQGVVRVAFIVFTMTIVAGPKVHPPTSKLH